MNKEQTAISKTIVQWEYYAKTGTDSKLDYEGVRGVLDNCYLCGYSASITGLQLPSPVGRCQACPYYKRYGMCNKPKASFVKWTCSTTKQWRQHYANIFLREVKTLQEKEMNKEDKIELMEKIAIAATETVVELKAQLEAEKPKPLEHGDWWWKEENPKNVRVFLKEIKDKKRDCVALDDGLLTTIGSAYRGEIIQGNIFREMEALQEPLEEFEMDVHKYYINKGEGWGHAPVHIAGNNHTLAEFHDFILNLRRMEATLKK